MAELLGQIKEESRLLAVAWPPPPPGPTHYRWVAIFSGLVPLLWLIRCGWRRGALLRWTFNALALLSLLICLAAAVLWRASAEQEIQVARTGYPLVRFKAVVSSGSINLLNVVPHSNPLPGTESWRSWKKRYPYPVFFHRWGASIEVAPVSAGTDGSEPPPPVTGTAYYIRIPLWAIVIASAPVPGIWMYRSMCRRRWFANNRCVQCGYDLRASPDRCPECGTAAGSAAWVYTP